MKFPPAKVHSCAIVPPTREGRSTQDWAPSYLMSRDTPLSNIYGNMFALCWKFVGSDLDHPFFLSNMFCQIPSEISFIHSSSFSQQHPSLLPVPGYAQRFPALTHQTPVRAQQSPVDTKKLRGCSQWAKLFPLCEEQVFLPLLFP